MSHRAASGCVDIVCVASAACSRLSITSMCVCIHVDVGDTLGKERSISTPQTISDIIFDPRIY